MNVGTSEDAAQRPTRRPWALAAYRELLNRAHLGGKSVAARFMVNGRSLYFSRFNRPYGQKNGRSRIHPKAPLDPHLDPNDHEKINAIMAWTPTGHLITPAPERHRNEAGRDIEVEKLTAKLVVDWLAPMARANRKGVRGARRIGGAGLREPFERGR